MNVPVRNGPLMGCNDSQQNQSCKKKILLIFIFTFMFAWQQVFSQSSATATIDANPKALSIGDEIPEALWNLPLQVVNHPQGKQTITLREHKDKLIILDFWATWCGPCIKSLNKLDTIQKEFKDDVIIIPTSYEKSDKVLKTFLDKGWTLQSVFSDTISKLYFPHLSLPHQVVINKSKVLAITSSSEINSQRISNILTGSKQQFKLKREIDIDRFQSIIPYVNTENRRQDFQSILTGYVSGISNSGYQNNNDLQELHVFNQPISFLYSTILKIFPNELELQVANEEWFSEKKRNVYDNLFCYQLIVPMHISSTGLKDIALSNLNNFLNLNGRFEKINKECYVIVDKTGNPKQPIRDRSTKTEFPIKTVVGILNFSLNWKRNAPRFINESTYQGSFWVENPDKEIANLKNDISKLNEFLSDYNLKIIKETRKVDVFVISENLHKP